MSRYSLRFSLKLLVGLSLAVDLIPRTISIAEASEVVVGIGVHLTASNRPITRSMELVARVGATSFRDDAFWSLVEQEKGVLRIPPHWDVLVDEAVKRGIEPLLILGYGNPHYDGGDKPRTKEAVSAFSRYATHVATHFRGRVGRYEIWNEWDNTLGNTTIGSSEDYLRLVREVYPALKGVDTQLEVLAGAVTSEALREGRLRKLVELGILKFSDGLSIHPYVHCGLWDSPMDWAVWMRKIDQELVRLTGASQPLYVTEIGWPSSKGKCGVSEARQAEYVEETLRLLKEIPSLRGLWWYDLQDDGGDQYNQEHNFGLLRVDFSVKPAYLAMKRMLK